MKRLLIFGAGGHAMVIYDIAKKMELFDSILFIEKNPIKNKFENEKLISQQSLSPQTSDKAIIAIGDNNLRLKVYSELKLKWPKLKFAKLIHPNTIIASNVKIGQGSVVMGGSVINSHTIIGNHCVINTKASLDHEVQINDFASIAPGCTLGGNVKVGKRSFVGLGSNIIQGVHIKNDICIGAGSLVLKNIEKSGIYFGSPVQFIKN